MEKLLKRFHQLSEREQYLVIACSVVLVVGMFYWLVWAPLNNAIDTNRSLVKNKKSDLVWLTENVNRALQLQRASGGKRQFTGSLTQAVNQTASRVRISISRMQPQGEELKVWVDQAPFNDVLSWVQTMENMGIHIINIDIAQADAPGLVKIRSLQLGKS